MKLERDYIKNGKYILGKASLGDCEITWELYKNKRGKICFSMQAAEWDKRHYDYDRCGQCVEYIAGLFPKDKKAQRMMEIWKRYHLNDMRAGTPKQEDYLREKELQGWEYKSYKNACETLKAAGLYEDNGYKYGHAWNYEEIPEEIIKEIMAW